MVNKQLSSRKVPSFPTFLTIKRQYFGLLANKINLQMSVSDRQPLRTDMLISSRSPLFIGQFAQQRRHDKICFVGIHSMGLLTVTTPRLHRRFCHVQMRKIRERKGKHGVLVTLMFCAGAGVRKI